MPRSAFFYTVRERWRAEPLAEALRQLGRPATVISKSPDAESTEAMRLILGA